MIIRPDPRRRDWFLSWGDNVEKILPLGVPGIQPHPKLPGSWQVHRSHLPVLLVGSVRALGSTTKPEDWADRDDRFEVLGIKLRTTQHQAIDFIKPRRGVLLADDMRAGKTMSAIGSHDPNDGPLVVVGPLSSRGVWLGWMRRVFPEFRDRIGILLGRKFDASLIQDKPLVFAHYDILGGWQVDMPIGTLVFDEAHALTNKDSIRARAAAFLAARATRVICVTGTPIWNMPINLWNVLSLCCPGAFGSYDDFGQRYCGPEATAYGTTYKGSGNQAELAARLQEVMIRRRWCDIAADLPPISRNVVVAEIDEPMRKRLDIAAAAIVSERTNTAGNLARYRRVLTRAKLRVTVAEAVKRLEAGEPVVVWTWHVDFAEEIAEALASKGYTAFSITGEIPYVARDQTIEEWKAAPKASPLVATMSVGQVAIDLSHARFAIFAEIDYTPAILGQTEMRTFTPTRAMDVTYVIADHMIDQRIVAALLRKLGAQDPLGVGAAVDAIDSLRTAIVGPQEVADIDRLLEDLLAA